MPLLFEEMINLSANRFTGSDQYFFFLTIASLKDISSAINRAERARRLAQWWRRR